MNKEEGEGKEEWSGLVGGVGGGGGESQGLP